ncbi:hypothetical protein RHGRI_025616 [Rhododendron griersonianum]|uniref:Uncharacterized protein n=1 Tax=Rhododendron griersonianum TaxID=479676 RepID=A0AAV6IS20_9ERIC|nr:hypothetical protein RHGRI_025607 [Rhododendron griersonianum]KAG5530704.1 hypothetical protein RHGRI_025616 [Rhododendron griersonianum]
MVFAGVQLVNIGVLKELLDLDASSRKIQVLNNLNSVQFYASVILSKRIRDCAGVDAFKEIARLSTHSTLAACGLERPKPGVCSFQSSVCCHSNQVEVQQLRRMSTVRPSSCRECCQGCR